MSVYLIRCVFKLIPIVATSDFVVEATIQFKTYIETTIHALDGTSDL